MSSKMFDGGLLASEGPFALGIDPSLTGFALTALSTLDDTYVTWVYGSKLRGVARLTDIADWLIGRIAQLHSGFTCDLMNVAMESGVVRSSAALAIGELHGVVKYALAQDDIYPLQVPPASLKKYVTGKGNSGKSEMLLQVYRRWGVEFNDDNAADSYGLARIARGDAETNYQRDVIEKLTDPKFRESLS